MLQFHCSGCDQPLRVAAGLAGKAVACPHCSGMNQVPNSSVDLVTTGVPCSPVTAPGTLSFRPDVTPPASIEMAPPNGQVLSVPGYQLLNILGRGGMGVVYRARHLALNRIVALKMLQPSNQGLEHELKRFRAEAEAVARLQHPNIVQIFDSGISDGKPYLALEYCDGGSLATRLDGTPFLPVQAIALVEQLAQGVAAAHHVGIIHRDLKPGNVLLARGSQKVSGEGPNWDLKSPLAEDVPKIADFGLAKKVDDDSGQTKSGSILGTPQYMAPEQALGEAKHVGPSADIYALGAILYELLTGRPPFKGATVLETLEQVRGRDPVPPHVLRPRIPRDLETICLKCLNKEPRRRYTTATELAEDLRRCQNGEPIRGRPVGRVERVVKWARRRPGVAALAAAVVLCVVAGMTGITWAYGLARSERKIALTERDNARAAEASIADERDIANAAKARLAEERDRVVKARADEARARTDEQRQLYHSRIALAYNEWLSGNVGRVEELLDLCPPALLDWEWRHLKRLCQSDQTTLSWMGWPNCALYTPDSKYLLTGAGRVAVWDVSRTRLLREFASPERTTANALSLSPDGKRVAVGYGNEAILVPSAVRIWDIETGKLLQEFAGFDASVVSVAFSPDGERLAAVSGHPLAPGPNKGKIVVWDLSSEEVLWTVAIPYRLGHFGQMAFSPDGKHLATATNPLCLWDAVTGKQLYSVATDGAFLTYNPDGTRLALIEGAEIVLRDPGTGAVLQRCQPGVTEAPRYRSVIFSPDGQKVGAAGASRIIRFWDPATGRLTNEIRGHRNWVNALAIRPDNNQLASLSADGAIKLWDLTQAIQGMWQVTGESAAFVRGNTILTSVRNELQMREATSGRVLDSFRVEGQAITCLESSRDGRVIAAGQRDGKIVVYELDRKQVRHQFVGHTKPVTRLVFDRRGQRLASVSEDGVACLWDLVDGNKLHQTPPVASRGQILALHPDGDLLVTQSARTGARTTLTCWNAKTGKEVGRRQLLEGYGCAFSEDGRRLAIIEEYNITLWDLSEASPWDEKARPTRILRGHNFVLFDVAFSADGKRLVSMSHDYTWRVWDCDTGESTLRLPANGMFNSRMRFSRDCHHLAMIGAGRVTVYDAQPSPRLLSKVPGMVWSLTGSPSSETVVVGCADGTIEFRDAKGEVSQSSVKVNEKGVRRVSISPDGRSLAIAGLDGAVVVWDLPSRKKRWNATASTSAQSVAFSPDNQLLAVGGNDGFIRLFVASNGRELASLGKHAGSVYDVAFSRDSRTLASVGPDKTVRLWDLTASVQSRLLEEHTAATHCVVFLADGKTLLSGDTNGTLKRWNMDDWTAETSELPSGVASLALSSDGRTLAIGTFAGQVRLLDAASGRELASHRDHTGRVNGLVFGADGKSVFSGGQDSRFLRWDFPATGE